MVDKKGKFPTSRNSPNKADLLGFDLYDSIARNLDENKVVDNFNKKD